MKTFKKPLPQEEELYYLRLVKEGDKDAKDKIMEHNLRLVAHIVKKYHTRDRDLDDLISIGTIGLIKAVNTFDLEKGGRLGTYAARCIENELLMMLRQEKKKMREVSLYEPIGMDADGNHISLLDVLCTEEESLTDRYLYQYYLEHLEEILDSLEDGRDKDIILARYGLRGQKPKTQREVAENMGISRSYVSRIEKKVLQKLKEQCDKI